MTDKVGTFMIMDRKGKEQKRLPSLAIAINEALKMDVADSSGFIVVDDFDDRVCYRSAGSLIGEFYR